MTLELGTTSLSQARLARGLTLEDAERSTRISRKFLIALEEHDYSVFPAPVYARGFLRTYCRYLGVDPEIQLAELPAGWTESTAPTTQLAPVSTRAPMTFNFAWVLAGAVLVAVIGLAMILSRGGGDLGELEQQGLGQQNEGNVPADTGSNTATSPANQTAGNQTQPAASPTAVTTAVGRTLDPGLPGILPDFQEVAFQDVTAFLDQQDIAYLRIDAASDTTPEGLVISQSPEPGVETADLAQVTLTVSTGSTPVTTDSTDCAELEASNQRTVAEQAYFEANCAPADVPAALPDRTTCEEIRGTDYRSPSERTFFLANCIIQ